MKRLIYFSLTLFFIIGCSNNDYEPSNPQLTVKESVLDFSAKGGEGYILVESKNAINAISNFEWCQVQVSENKITVTVDPYDGIENRSAVVSISATSGDYPVNIPVTQLASKFIIENQTFNVDFTPSSVKTAVTADNEVTVSSNDEWIEAKYENDSIIINVSLNPNASKRTGSVTVTSGVVSQTIEIIQAERTFAFEDLLGDWEMTFQLFPPATRYATNIKLSKSATPNYYDVTGLGIGTLRIRFNNANKTLEIFGGHNMGPDPTDPSRTIAALLLSSDGYITWNSAAFYRGIWNKGFNQDMIFNFEDSGTWVDKTIVGLYLVSSTQYPVVSGSYQYVGALFTNISLKKL